jgi:Protein of unknown function (DUF3572)
MPLRPGQNPQPLPREGAELLGLQALGWVAARPALVGRFLSAAGASAEEMRARAADPEFLGFVLDFLLADEEALLAFASETGVAPDRPLRARAALPGGALPHWT